MIFTSSAGFGGVARATRLGNDPRTADLYPLSASSLAYNNLEPPPTRPRAGGPTGRRYSYFELAARADFMPDVAFYGGDTGARLAGRPLLRCTVSIPLWRFRGGNNVIDYEPLIPLELLTLKDIWIMGR